MTENTTRVLNFNAHLTWACFSLRGSEFLFWMPDPAKVTTIKYDISPLCVQLNAHMHIWPGHMTAATTEINYRLVTSPLSSVWVQLRSPGELELPGWPCLCSICSSVDLLLLWLQTGSGSGDGLKFSPHFWQVICSYICSYICNATAAFISHGVTTARHSKCQLTTH